MKDHDLERYARHLSLPELGMKGQEKLLATSVSVPGELPDVVRALKRMGVKVQANATLAIVMDATLQDGEVVFDGSVQIGPQNFSGAKHRDASAPLHMKQRFFSGLVASELVLWVTGKRPARFRLYVDYPTYQRVDDA
jgi:hypothetical protein